MRSGTAQLFVMTPVNARRPEKEGELLPVRLEQMVIDHVGNRTDGPNQCGRAELLDDGRVAITLSNSLAGRTAAALLRDDVLDAVLRDGSVRLRA